MASRGIVGEGDPSRVAPRSRPPTAQRAVGSRNHASDSEHLTDGVACHDGEDAEGEEFDLGKTPGFAFVKVIPAMYLAVDRTARTADLGRVHGCRSTS